MTLRGCVIGNSHVASLKLGWEKSVADFPGVNLTFFAAPRQRFRRTFVRDGVLGTKDPIVAENLRLTGGADTIGLASYDFFCVVGGGVNSRILLRMQGKHTLFSGANTGESYISEPYLRACYKAIVQQSAAKHLVDLLTTATASPVFYTPDPHLSNDADTLARNFPEILRIKARGGISLSNLIFKQTIEDVFSNVSKIVYQLAETIDDEILTKVEYARGPGLSQAAAKPDEEDDSGAFGDIYHLNADYGALFWIQFFRTHLYEYIARR